MKTHLLILAVSCLSLAPLSLATASIDDPGKYCDVVKSCTPAMKVITTAYNQSGLKFIEASLSAYSGGCYYLNSAYNPNEKQLGTFLFENDSEGLKSDGIFSFFYRDNPYMNYTSQQLKYEFVKRGYKSIPVEIVNNSVEMAPKPEFKYWFRSDDTAQNVYMIARQAGQNSTAITFCHLRKLADRK